jgi:SCY1-like protein 1
MDVVEGDGTIYIMTERVKPLSEELISWEAKPVKDRQDWLLWGLHRVTVRTQVLNCSAPSENMGAVSLLDKAACLY